MTADRILKPDAFRLHGKEPHDIPPRQSKLPIRNRHDIKRRRSQAVDMDHQACGIFLEKARYLLLTEYRTKIRLAVEALPEDALWWRANDQSNSVGNLLLHLTGNVRQWMVSGVGGAPDIRHRAAEFAAHNGPPRAELLANLNRTLDDVERVLHGLAPDALLEQRTIQGRDVTVLDAIFICVEHFSHAPRPDHPSWRNCARPGPCSSTRTRAAWRDRCGKRRFRDEPVMRTWNLAGGLLLAVALAAPFIVPRIGGIDTWKILLAIGGLVVFRYGDRLARK